MRLLSPIDRLRAALTDPARRERNVLWTLVVYVLLWTAYGTITKSGQGLHPDMTELLDWSRHLAWGYKHPPLAAAIVWLWFSVFPVAAWSYYLLAMLMPALTLWIGWRLSADYLDIEKRIFGIALLTLVPFFNFHALKFNVNTVLLPLWAATTLWFLRSYTTRGTLYAALAGAGAAAAMLGKYWSIFLIAGLVVAALADKRRNAYFRSAAPWITIAVGLIVIAPHLVWLVQHHFEPFGYAMSVHGEKPFADVATSALGYLAGSAGYVAVPVIVVLAILFRSSPRKQGPRAESADAVALDSRSLLRLRFGGLIHEPVEAPWRRRVRGNGRGGESARTEYLLTALADMAWPADDKRRLAAAAFWAPLLLPVAAALASGTDITSLWSMSAWTLLPVLLLSPPAMMISQVDTRRLLAFAVALPAVMLLVSPAILHFLPRP